MSTITVDDSKGRVLYYEDTGPPSASSTEYLTIVLIHGLGINGAIFRNAFPFAAPHGIRLVAVNSREYAGSSKFTLEEVEALRNGTNEDQAAVVAGLGTELAVFLVRFIQKHNIPKLTAKEGRRTGGIAILGWSIGCATLLSFLAHGPHLPKDTRFLLDDYLRSTIAHDCSSSSYGIPMPEGFRSVWTDPSLTPDEARMLFLYYASVYQSPVADLSTVAVPMLLVRNETDIREATLRAVSPEVLSTFLDINALKTWPLLIRAMPALQENLYRAYFDTRGIWPNVDVNVLWADSGSWAMLWGAKYLSDRVAAWGQGMRKLQFIRMENANHFVHWDEPERFIRILKNTLDL